MAILCEQAQKLDNPNFIKHGFFARHGGISQAPWGSLNNSYLVGDQNKFVTENRQRVINYLNFNSHKLYVPNLVHGNKIIFLPPKENYELTTQESGDAVVCCNKLICVGITYADCVPILLTNNTCFVAAIHAGWRGIKKNIIGKTLDFIRNKFAKFNIRAAIGPAISQGGFVVRKEVKKFFCDNYLEFTINNFDSAQVNLRAICEYELRQHGAQNIEIVGGNTDLNTHNYFSHRKSQGSTGRHLAIIGFAS